MNRMRIRLTVLAAVVLLAGLTLSALGQGPGAPLPWARGVEGQRKADLGNGTYLNPIMAGDHPDPSVLRDGADYYMTFSSFDAYPGLVIWHSRDLVNWQPIGPSLFRNVGSVWAPDLVKHNGRYYIYFPGIGASYRSNYVIWADDIRGPWSDPIDLKVGRIDPGHAVGPDGSRWLFLSGGYLVPLAADGLSVDRRDEEGVRRLAVPGRLGRGRVRPGGAEDPEARPVLLHGPRRRRHGRPADEPHGDCGEVEDHRRSVGELAIQSGDPNLVAGRAVVVEGPCDAG